MRTTRPDPRALPRSPQMPWALGLFAPALFLSGCPLYLDGNAGCDRDTDCPAGRVCDPVADRCVIPPECAVDSDCASGEICTAGMCETGSRSCRTHGDCDRGRMCDVGTCEPSVICSPVGDDSDCTALAPTGFWCDFRDTCVPRTPGACRTIADCSGGDRCTEGVCTPVEDTCQFDRECVGGTSCLNAECSTLCGSDADCGNGDECVGGFCRTNPGECATSATCAAGENCVDGRCLADCTAGASACDETEHCAVDRFCHPDWQPTPVCTVDTDCMAGRVCRSGVCRTPCTAPANPSTTCTLIDGTLPDCRMDAASGDFLCFALVEAMPECRTSDDCMTAEDCANATCRAAP